MSDYPYHQEAEWARTATAWPCYNAPAA